MTRWYRAYENTVSDPKLGEAAAVAGCSRSTSIAAWHALLESACQANDEGRFVTTARRVAIILGEPPELITRLLDAFGELGMITSGAITAWTRRQYHSDSSTERSRQHRGRKRNGDATLQDRRATVPDTDTDTEVSDADASGAVAPPAAPTPPVAPSAIDLKAAVFACGVPLLTRTGTSDRGARSMLGRWRQSFGDGAVLDALAGAQAGAVSAPIAWITAELRRRNEKRRDYNDDGPRNPMVAAAARAVAEGGG